MYIWDFSWKVSSFRSWSSPLPFVQAATMDLCVCEYCICPLEKFVFSAASSFLPDAAAVSHLRVYCPSIRDLYRGGGGGTIVERQMTPGSPVNQGKALSLRALPSFPNKELYQPNLHHNYSSSSSASKSTSKGLASHCKAKTTFAFHFSIINA